MNKDERYWNAVKILENVLDELPEAEREPKDVNLEGMEEKRERVFSRYREIFQNIDDLSRENFESFLSFEGNEHWTGLHRQQNSLTRDMTELNRVLRICLDETQRLGTRIDSFWRAKPKGLGKAILTAFLLVASRGKYGVWNEESGDALKYLGIWPKFPRGASFGSQYEELNVLLTRLAKDIEIDLWVLDWLFNELLKVYPVNSHDPQTSEEISEMDQASYPAGAKVQITVNRYERDPKARKQCLKHYGAICYICSFDFGKVYGSQYNGIIHVHHITPLSEVTEGYKVKPKKDLLPVCPNCHAVIHKSRPALTKEQIDELEKKIEARSK